MVTVILVSVCPKVITLNSFQRLKLDYFSVPKRVQTLRQRPVVQSTPSDEFSVPTESRNHFSGEKPDQTPIVRQAASPQTSDGDDAVPDHAVAPNDEPTSEIVLGRLLHLSFTSFKTIGIIMVKVMTLFYKVFYCQIQLHHKTKQQGYTIRNRN